MEQQMLWRSVGDSLQLLLQFPLTGELVSCACVCGYAVSDVWQQQECRTDSIFVLPHLLDISLEQF